MINNKMQIKVQLVNNVNDPIVGKKNTLISSRDNIFVVAMFRRRDNTHASQSGAETEERM
jgi:hypothetical protein